MKTKTRKKPETVTLEPKREMMQVVWLVFSDGTKAGFTGKAVCFPGETKSIRDISFTEPREMPEGCSFGTI